MRSGSLGEGGNQLIPLRALHNHLLLLLLLLVVVVMWCYSGMSAAVLPTEGAAADVAARQVFKGSSSNGRLALANLDLAQSHWHV